MKDDAVASEVIQVITETELNILKGKSDKYDEIAKSLIGIKPRYQQLDGVTHSNLTEENWNTLCDIIILLKHLEKYIS